MIINFPYDKKTYGEYCLTCHAASTLTSISVDGTKALHCEKCSANNPRSIIIDPKLKWWTDDDARYYHESVGIVLVNDSRQVLLYELTKFPYGFTIPAGHIDNGESATDAIIREAREEVGISLHNPERIAYTMINGDSCRRGCDDHMWSLFIEHIRPEVATSIVVDEHEGKMPIWVSVDDVKSLNLPSAMSHLFNEYFDELKQAVTRR